MDRLRPMSLTPTLAKVPETKNLLEVLAETFVSQWMMEDMTPHLDSRRFGNRKGRSTSH